MTLRQELWVMLSMWLWFLLISLLVLWFTICKRKWTWSSSFWTTKEDDIKYYFPDVPKILPCCITRKRFVVNRIVMRHKLECFVTCPIVCLCKPLDILICDTLVVVEQLHHSRKSLPAVLGTKSDAWICQGSSVFQLLLKGGCASIIFLPCHIALP